MNDGRQSEIGGRRNSRWAIAAHDLADAVRTGRYSLDERLPTLVSLAVVNEVRPPDLVARPAPPARARLRHLPPGYGYFVSHTPPGYE